MKSGTESTKETLRLRCTYCHGAVVRVEAVNCASCLALHHADCHREHGCCATHGCGERAVLERGVDPATRRAWRHERRIAAVALAANVALVAIVGYRTIGSDGPNGRSTPTDRTIGPEIPNGRSSPTDRTIGPEISNGRSSPPDRTIGPERPNDRSTPPDRTIGPETPTVRSSADERPRAPTIFGPADPSSPDLVEPPGHWTDPRDLSRHVRHVTLVAGDMRHFVTLFPDQWLRVDDSDARFTNVYVDSGRYLPNQHGTRLTCLVFTTDPSERVVAESSGRAVLLTPTSPPPSRAQPSRRP